MEERGVESTLPTKCAQHANTEPCRYRQRLPHTKQPLDRTPLRLYMCRERTIQAHLKPPRYFVEQTDQDLVHVVKKSAVGISVRRGERLRREDCPGRLRTTLPFPRWSTLVRVMMQRPVDVLLPLVFTRRFPSLWHVCVSFSLDGGGSSSACRFHSFGENDDAETEDVVHIRGAFVLPKHLRKALALSNAQEDGCW